MKTLARRISFFVILGMVLAVQTSLSFGVEPIRFFQGMRNVRSAYERFDSSTPSCCIPRGIYDIPPVYLATFGEKFFDERLCIMAGLSTSRVSMAKNVRPKCFVPPMYIIEFPEESMNKLPRTVQEAVVNQFLPAMPEGPSFNLLGCLRSMGVEKVFVTACGLGPTHSCDTGVLLSDFTIMPHGFMGHEFYNPISGDPFYDGRVLIGLFENTGIRPLAPNPMVENALALQELPFYDFDTYSGNALSCQLANINGIASFYVVAMTPNKKNVLITQVLIVNDRPKAVYIRDNIFATAPSFSEILNGLNTFSGTCENPTSKDALQHTYRSLAILSGNAEPIRFNDGARERNAFAVTLFDSNINRGFADEYVLHNSDPLLKVYEMQGDTPLLSYSGKFPVCQDSVFELTCECQSTGSEASCTLFGIDCINERGSIFPCQYEIVERSETELALPCVSGDTVITIRDASKWGLPVQDLHRDNRGWVAFNIDDSGAIPPRDIPNFNIAGGIVEIDKSTGRIRLQKGITKDYPVGTKVREHYVAGNGGYMYCLIGTHVPSCWTKYRAVISTSGSIGEKLRTSTKYIKPVLFGNHNQTSAAISQFKNIKLRQIFFTD